MDVPTLQGWIEALGYTATPDGAATLRIQPRESTPSRDGGKPSGHASGHDGGELLPPFYVQLSENWVLLSMLPMLGRGAYHAEDLGRRLLAANREMRLAKFALDKNGAVVLCAELPTESLDASEIADAVKRMTEYAERFAAELVRHRG
jgi:Tir chaperone protein (CesT) family